MSECVRCACVFPCEYVCRVFFFGILFDSCMLCTNYTMLSLQFTIAQRAHISVLIHFNIRPLYTLPHNLRLYFYNSISKFFGLNVCGCMWWPTKLRLHAELFEKRFLFCLNHTNGSSIMRRVWNNCRRWNGNDTYTQQPSKPILLWKCFKRLRTLRAYHYTCNAYPQTSKCSAHKHSKHALAHKHRGLYTIEDVNLMKT